METWSKVVVDAVKSFRVPSDPDYTEEAISEHVEEVIAELDFDEIVKLPDFHKLVPEAGKNTTAPRFHAAIEESLLEIIRERFLRQD